MTQVRFGSTPDGRRIEVSRRIDAPVDRAWELLTDTDRWPEWGPSVAGVECAERVIEPGSTGRIETPVALDVPFEVIDCAPYRWTWRILRVPATGHRVEPIGSGACRVVFEVPPLAAPYVPVCERALGRIERLV